MTATIIHSTGLTWESFAALLTPILGLLAAGLRFIAKRIETNRNELRNHFKEVTTKFTTLDAIGSRPVRDLSAKLDLVNTELQKLDRRSGEISERVARLEGPIRDVTNGVGSKPK